MAKKKAELEKDVIAYEACIARMEALLQRRLYEEALNEAVAAWKHVDGMMQFKSRYEQKQFESVRCVDIVTTYAPVLFRSDVLEHLEALLQSQRRVERNTAADLGHALATARRRMVDAHRLWNLIAQPASTKIADLAVSLGGDLAEWEAIARLWSNLGVVRFTNNPIDSVSLEFASNLEASCRGKCAHCGAVVRALQRRLLEAQNCPKCGIESMYCLLN